MHLYFRVSPHSPLNDTIEPTAHKAATGALVGIQVSAVGKTTYEFCNYRPKTVFADQPLKTCMHMHKIPSCVENKSAI